MKIFIASDIHGSEHYCKIMAEKYREESADKLLLLGDLLYHGPRNDLPLVYNPRGVITILNSLKNEIICVRGNCDTEVDQMVLDFPIMAEYAIIYDGNKTIYATHGHKFNPQNSPMLKSGDILLNGKSLSKTFNCLIKICQLIVGANCVRPFGNFFDRVN